ncbi:MAG: helix-turn-helix transcriptional regulator [Ruminococcaceae bacterium]|nr:helix-turn-helix transcriptional regulator [Oscillospiraceae bacterium]
MYISYSNLWKTLVDKKISKTELMELTGMSSRTLAKLSKNETVTTETIASICTALSCSVSDVMECVSEQELSFYSYYRKFGEITEEDEYVNTVRFTFKGKKIVIYVTKKSAGKGSHIHCRDDETLYWEQLYMFGGMSTPRREENILIRPKRGADEIAIVVIKGKPSTITGLDEGIFVSAKRGRLISDKDIFVMSEAVFKLFDPNIN